MLPNIDQQISNGYYDCKHENINSEDTHSCLELNEEQFRLFGFAMIPPTLEVMYMPAYSRHKMSLVSHDQSVHFG